MQAYKSVKDKDIQLQAYRISRQSAHEGKVVSLTHLSPLAPKRYPWYSFPLVVELATVRPEGLTQ